MAAKRPNILVLLGLSFALTLTTSAQVGHILSGVGSVDQSMSGAGTANPQDILGALHWNPAAIANQESSALSVSLQALFPSGTLASSVNANAFGPNFPGSNLSGSSESNAGPFPIPAIGFVYATPDNRWAAGISAFGVGGFGVDFEIDPTNPITTPQAPSGFGFGAVFSEFQLLQISPTIAYQVAEGISIGAAPTINLSSLEVSPFPATSPDDANGDGFPSYPDAPRDWATGYGFQAGVQITQPSGFMVGASFKSRQNFSDFEFHSVDEMGNSRTFGFNLDYPRIISLGLGYSGIDRVDLVADVRHINFEKTDGFRDAAYDQTGMVTGFGWQSIIAIAAGLEYEVSERMPIRFGYSWNENPVQDENTFFNIPSPALIQHRISGGLSYKINDRLTGSAAVQYGFKNEVNGQWVSPMGPMPGTSVDCDLSTFFAVIGLEVGL